MTGFKGDWKGIKQVLNFIRYADKDEVGCSRVSVFIIKNFTEFVRGLIFRVWNRAIGVSLG